MARITIVPEDNVVLVDREARTISMAGIDPTIHAVQWFGANGEIEYNDGKSHEQINDITPFQVFIDRWTAAAPPPQPPDSPKSDAPLTAEELAVQMIADGIITQAKINAIKAAR